MGLVFNLEKLLSWVAVSIDLDDTVYVLALEVITRLTWSLRTANTLVSGKFFDIEVFQTSIVKMVRPEAAGEPDHGGNKS
jgi:hypothetical protein